MEIVTLRLFLRLLTSTLTLLILVVVLVSCNEDDTFLLERADTEIDGADKPELNNPPATPTPEPAPGTRDPTPVIEDDEGPLVGDGSNGDSGPAAPDGAAPGDLPDPGNAGNGGAAGVSADSSTIKFTPEFAEVVVGDVFHIKIELMIDLSEIVIRPNDGPSGPYGGVAVTLEANPWPLSSIELIDWWDPFTGTYVPADEALDTVILVERPGAEYGFLLTDLTGQCIDDGFGVIGLRGRKGASADGTESPVLTGLGPGEKTAQILCGDLTKVSTSPYGTLESEVDDEFEVGIKVELLVDPIPSWLTDQEFLSNELLILLDGPIALSDYWNIRFGWKPTFEDNLYVVAELPIAPGFSGDDFWKLRATCLEEGPGTLSVFSQALPAEWLFEVFEISNLESIAVIDITCEKAVNRITVVEAGCREIDDLNALPEFFTTTCKWIFEYEDGTPLGCGRDIRPPLSAMPAEFAPGGIPTRSEPGLFEIREVSQRGKLIEESFHVLGVGGIFAGYYPHGCRQDVLNYSTTVERGETVTLSIVGVNKDYLVYERDGDAIWFARPE